MPKMFGAKFPLPLKREKLVFSCADNIPAGSTRYLTSMDQGGEEGGGVQATENLVRANYLVARDGILRNFVVFSYPAGVGETKTYTVRVNGAPTALTCQLTGAVQTTASDLVNSVHVVVGDRVTVEVVTSAAAPVNPSTTSLDYEVDMTRLVFNHYNFTSASSTIAANLTRYLYSSGRQSYTGGVQVYESSPLTEYLVTRKGSLKNLVILAAVAPGIGETFVYTVRVNGVNTAMTVTLSGAAQLTGTDIVNVVQVDAGDRITIRVVTSAAAAVTTHAASFGFEEGDYRAG